MRGKGKAAGVGYAEGFRAASGGAQLPEEQHPEGTVGQARERNFARWLFVAARSDGVNLKFKAKSKNVGGAAMLLQFLVTAIQLDGSRCPFAAR